MKSDNSENEFLIKGCVDESGGIRLGDLMGHVASICNWKIGGQRSIHLSSLSSHS